MRRRVALSVILLMSLAQLAQAYCNLPQPRLVCAEYFQTRAVVIARLIASKHFAPHDRQDWHFYTMRVEKRYRGSVPETFWIYEENSSGRAPFDWRKNESYLLFLEHSSNIEGRDAWTLDGCGNSAPFTGARKTLAEIDHIIDLPRVGGLVVGEIRPYPRELGPNFSLVVRSRNREYRAKVTKAGEIKTRLPAGTYSIPASQGKWLFEGWDVTYEDPARFTIHDNGCAQLLIGASATSKPPP